MLRYVKISDTKLHYVSDTKLSAVISNSKLSDTK